MFVIELYYLVTCKDVVFLKCSSEPLDLHRSGAFLMLICYDFSDRS